ncbi:MAG: outer membrane lipoprotein SlyB [Myxococcota bacterium]|jgi:outer membrane lipoprotein SlyB
MKKMLCAVTISLAFGITGCATTAPATGSTAPSLDASQWGSVSKACGTRVLTNTLQAQLTKKTSYNTDTWFAAECPTMLQQAAGPATAALPQR